MTKEINDILNAYKEATLRGRQSALATVVHVEGSSYRRPGARMLVEDNGKLTGAVSGGCLEGDALKKALSAIQQQQKKLVVYNTTDEDDAQFGVQLGCNGIVHILFEPIDPLQASNPITILQKCFAQKRNTVLVTLFSLNDPYGNQPGTTCLFDGETFHGEVHDKMIDETLKEEALIVIETRMSLLKQFTESKLAAFVELVEPPVSLVIVGAGNDALPLVEMATILGWQIIVVDGRPTHANRKRFPNVHELIVGKPAEALKQLVIDERSVVVLMTHNYNYDLAMMGLLLPEKCNYIGCLGPRKKLDRLLTDLEDQGHILTDIQRAKIYGPTGLDIGAETAEEIALSVLAEIKSVLSNRPGSSLRDRLDEIHSRSVMLMNENETSTEQ